MKTITTHKENLKARCLERGYKIEEVMDCVVQQNGDIWTIDVTHEKYPNIVLDHAKKRKPIPPEIGDGVGTEIKKILSWFNIRSNPNCSCYQRAKMLNDKGVEWCAKNKDIILSWLEEEAKKRNLPFLRYPVKKIINLAIHRARKKPNR